MDDLRKDCQMRHENGNCIVIGGFCTAVNDPICEGLHSAYDSGYRAAALRAKQERENPKQITNADRIRDMSDEELADMLWKTGRNYRSICADPVVDYNEQHEHLIDWLQHPVEEGRR